ncbi:unnamed protein product [Pelagomonas calceolata]|uniref:Protein SDA1 n=1 Tax=Pelagomonas calceolata TaxID=35677 RepID=A0A8J2WSH9_9STRA|nr:unnamed protein product [Pelagomonas calceolata]
MKVRQHSLPVLQNLLKRDPSAYREEFEAIWRQYLAALEAFRLGGASQKKTRGDDERKLGDLATFVAHCGVHYKEASKRFATDLVALLKDRCATLQPDLRLRLAQAAALARSKGLLDPLVLADLCFELIRRVRDKALRQFLADHVVRDCKKASSGTLGRNLRRCVFKAAEDQSEANSAASARVAVDVLVRLYACGSWTDAATVNCLGRCAADERARVALGAVYFFLGVDRAPVLDSESSENENEGEKGRDLKNALKAVDEHKHSKKTRARARQTKRAKKAAKKKALGKSERAEPKFPAMQLLDDPHRLCDALLARARRQVDAFEQRVARLDLCSRVACTHRLQLVAFYSYMRRYLKPSQEQAPRLLVLFAQACHELVPPDELVPIIRHVADAFVSDRNASEAMALGINALREVCGRCPAVLDEPEMLGLVRDLAAYSKHRDKSVVVAARGWINIVREHHPQLLQKKDRGRDKARSKATPLSFGADVATSSVPGEDLLRLYERGQLPEEFEDVVEACNDLEGGGDGWVDVSDGEEDGAAAADNDKDGWEDADSGSDDEEDEDGWVDVDQGSDSDAESNAGSDDDGDADEEEEVAPAARVLSAEDFARIKLLKARADELKGTATNRGLLSGADIVPEAVKRRTTVEERKARQVLDREKFQLKTHAGGKTNSEKRRTKNYLMVQKKKSRLNGLKKRKLGSGKGGKQQLGRDKRKRRRL